MELARRCVVRFVRAQAALQAHAPWMLVARASLGMQWVHRTPATMDRRRADGSEPLSWPTAASSALEDVASTLRDVVSRVLRASDAPSASLSLPGGMNMPFQPSFDVNDACPSPADTDSWTSSIWFAVPKRKTSYSKKRLRQMNPLYASHDTQAFYPCPKCDKGLLKLRHHLCPCDQETVHAKSVVKVKYAEVAAAAKEGKKEAAAASGTAGATS